MTTPIINHLSTRVPSFTRPPHAQAQDPRLPVGDDAAKITTAGDQQTLVRRAKEMGIGGDDRGQAGWALIPSPRTQTISIAPAAPAKGRMRVFAATAEATNFGNEFLTYLQAFCSDAQPRRGKTTGMCLARGT
ncbi:hypothetical protein HETIRDRAFT_447963 [Heterobasidion irregulare TC 32-1]|uniref:Uncharacterized protein n=1 Tax=Heterobasidion irregulare (strain TC 32-1) TaxID=747525 RepID=W4KNN7_HETIT|nr:uncharacterized protein HETIRDRAFT_447963 [Heterobasidion irregulare TC 32-1]ETW87453.1 hypothetical protein HETIRDRAFT_447963 [Heterobasidion irregulare TC 32-1]